MSFTLATWNINSVRLREGLVAKLMAEEAPDVLCLQECKSPVEKIPVEQFQSLGYRYMVARGQKGYNGVAILSKLPLQDAGGQDFASLGHARHVAARLENGVTIHNFYVPAGGDIPDRAQNEKFGQKLDFLTEMRDAFRADMPAKAILVGDLNIAPREDDVWDHKSLLKIVSHTPIEVAQLGETQAAGKWVGRDPRRRARGQALQLVELPRRRLERRRQGPPAGPRLGHARHRGRRPRQPHPARRAGLGAAKRPRAGVRDL